LPLFLFSLAMTFDLPPWKKKKILICCLFEHVKLAFKVMESTNLHTIPKKKGGLMNRDVHRYNCVTVLSPQHIWG
jgi:hypothetical protein